MGAGTWTGMSALRHDHGGNSPPGGKLRFFPAVTLILSMPLRITGAVDRGSSRELCTDADDE